MRIAIIGNFLPRQCGIATFTQNLVQAILSANDILSSGDVEIFAIAMNDPEQEYNYPETVKFAIRQNEREDYLKAADLLNSSGIDLCILQHEFGIYGGESGVYILSLLEQLSIPFVATLHTVLKTPSFHEKNILRKIGENAKKVIVMSKLAVKFLTTIYKIPFTKIEIIQHGVPDFTSSRKNISADFKLKNTISLSTFGLLGRSKGIETVINALPAVVKKFPDITYTILGKTHPNVKKHCGEEYREYLQSLVTKNNLQNNVFFIDTFLNEPELEKYLLTVDIYITPYLNEAQITSGTLSYAAGSGTCIVSTPFWHASELLANGRGELFNFGDSNHLAKVLLKLLSNPSKIQQYKERAFSYGKKMYWHQIGKQYVSLFNKVIEQPIYISTNSINKIHVQIPPFSLEHIKRLTDEVGIIEHANYSVPNFKEGYCLDDNARALLVMLMAYEAGLETTLTPLADIYLRYIKLMQKDDGYFHNDLGFDKKFLDETGSDDAFGRTIWAMGYMIKLAPNDAYFQFAKDVFFSSFNNFEKIESIRAIANIIMGIGHFLKRYPDNEKVLHTLSILTNKLIQQYKAEKDAEWHWFEPILCYDNAILPLALWTSYSIINNAETLKIATETTSFLDKKTIIGGHISLIGSKTWQLKNDDQRNLYGQQPINAMALVMMYQKAYEVTNNINFFQKMLLGFSWFTGNNDLYIPVYDEETKGCCDGIEKYCVNRNQGAESTISYYMALLTLAINAKYDKRKQNKLKINKNEMFEKYLHNSPQNSITIQL